MLLGYLKKKIEHADMLMILPDSFLISKHYKLKVFQKQIYQTLPIQANHEKIQYGRIACYVVQC